MGMTMEDSREERKEQTQEPALPPAFAERMQALLKEEAGAFFDSYGTERAQGLRFNPFKGDPKDLAARYGGRFGLRPVPWCRDGYYYEADSRPGRSLCHDAGIYYIQEPSAMAAGALLAPKPGERVLDLCAAPGGKTTHLAGMMRGEGLLISNEIHPARARILSQNVERMGIPNAVVTNEESARLRDWFPEFFDRIAVDAPCSGEGMFRKDEQARQEWSLENVALCAARQQEILENAAAMLKPGGTLVYSTCTFAPEEDEDGIAAFLERHPEFSIQKGEGLPGLSPGRPEWSRDKRADLADTWRIWPHLAEGEGHYLAVLRKAGEPAETEGAGPLAGRTGKGKKRKDGIRFWNDREGKKLLQECLKEILQPEVYRRWEQDGYLDRLLAFGDQIYLAPRGLPVLEGLRVLRPGLHLGTLKKNRLEPSHALALALAPGQVRAWVDLDSEGAWGAAYRNGQPLPEDLLSEGDRRPGWVLVCTDGCSLGWAKYASGSLKNHYPKGLRQ